MQHIKMQMNSWWYICLLPGWTSALNWGSDMAFNDVCAVAGLSSALCQASGSLASWQDDAAVKKKKKMPLQHGGHPDWSVFSLQLAVYYLIRPAFGDSHARWTQTTWPIEHPTDCVISACWIKNKHTGASSLAEETAIKWEGFPPSCTVYLAFCPLFGSDLF